MVPIHESDLAENRWKESQWSYFELWEKVELRFRRRRTRLVLAVILVFLGVSAIPILQDRLPKWRGTSVVRRLATAINEMKAEASRRGTPLMIELVSEADRLGYRVLELESCTTGTSGKELQRGQLVGESDAGQFSWMSPQSALELGLKPMIQSFCYDPLRESRDGVIAATQIMGLIPVKDLTDARLDRLSTVYLIGTSADISFD